MDLSYKTPSELQAILGQRLKAVRISRDMTQGDVALKAGSSLRAVQKLEAGKGSNLETLMRYLKAVDGLDALDALAPVTTISPMAMFAAEQKRPQRVRRPRPIVGNNL